MTGIEHDVFLVPSQFATIQSAIDAVTRPATIMISAGVYAEDLRVSGKHSLVIESTQLGRRGVTITGNAAASVIALETSSVYLSGIEIRSDQRARGISAVDSSISLQECVLAGNAVQDDGAGMLCRRSTVRVQKSTVGGNTVRAGGSGAAGGGLYLVDCKVEIAGSSIQTNAVYGSDSARGGGICCERSHLRVWRSRVTDNTLFGQNCEGAGIYFKDMLNARLGGSVIMGNGAAGGTGGGIFISGNSQPIAIHRDTVVRRNHPDDVIEKRQE
jgi:parallel beta helix pectate lyase-like protein